MQEDKANATAAEIPFLYVNTVQVKTSIFDVQLLLGHIEEISDNADVRVRNLLNVIMSPQHAKALVAVLSKTVAAYEDRFGALSLPELTEQFANEQQPPSSRSPGAARKRVSRRGPSRP